MRVNVRVTDKFTAEMQRVDELQQRQATAPEEKIISTKLQSTQVLLDNLVLTLLWRLRHLRVREMGRLPHGLRKVVGLSEVDRLRHVARLVAVRVRVRPAQRAGEQWRRLGGGRGRQPRLGGRQSDASGAYHTQRRLLHGLQISHQVVILFTGGTGLLGLGRRHADSLLLPWRGPQPEHGGVVLVVRVGHCEMLACVGWARICV